MAEPTLMDTTYSVIMKGFVETGQAPHYTEGEPVQVKVKDGTFESRDPEGLIGFGALPFAKWMRESTGSCHPLRRRPSTWR